LCDDLSEQLNNFKPNRSKTTERMAPLKTTGLEALESILDAHGMSAAGLARLLRVHRTLGAMILRGERKLTLDHVRTLARHFGVSAELFVW
jgi:antitoxin component HigA of HigAB toxin-antitoxin module